MSLRRRTFPEVLDNLLTAITKGVAAETHPFPPPGAEGPPFRHSLLQPPVWDVISVYGSRDGESHLFRKEADYQLLGDRQTLEWLEGAQLPDPGTLLYINYYPEAAQPVLTDIQTGSVVRTLAESVGLEIARVYAQLEAVYDAGFIDTASGSSLDNVVSLLGMKRVRGGRPAGQVELTRVPGSHGTISIPAGTRIITPDGEVEYETTESVTMAEGQNAIRVVARDLEEGNDPLPAGALTVLPVPIAGIAGVTNPAPTAILTQDETDAELRTRAKSFLHGSERATLGAIKEAVARQGISAEVEEVEEASGYRWVRVTPHAEELPPELQERLLKAIYESRPAGVVVDLQPTQPPRKVDLSLRLTTAKGLLEQDLRAAQRAVQEKVADYFSRLPAKDPGSVNRLVGLILSVREVEDVRILSATWTVSGSTQSVLDLANGLLAIGGFPTVLGELQITDPNLPTRLNVTVTFPEAESPPDQQAIQADLNAALTYLNELNASETLDAARRQISYGKLLHAMSLPNKPKASLQEYDQASAIGTPPLLPDETTVSPYQVQFVVTQESGLSRILSQAADSYTLTPFERLSLAGVEVQPEAGNG